MQQRPAPALITQNAMFRVRCMTRSRYTNCQSDARRFR